MAALLRRGRWDFGDVRRLQRVLREPRELSVGLGDLMAQLAPGVRFAWRDVETCCDVVALDRAMHLDRLLFRHARVVLAYEEQRRRLDVGRILDRRRVPERRD